MRRVSGGRDRPGVRLRAVEGRTGSLRPTWTRGRRKLISSRLLTFPVEKSMDSGPSAVLGIIVLLLVVASIDKIIDWIEICKICLIATTMLQQFSLYFKIKERDTITTRIRLLVLTTLLRITTTFYSHSSTTKCFVLIATKWLVLLVDCRFENIIGTNVEKNFGTSNFVFCVCNFAVKDFWKNWFSTIFFPKIPLLFWIQKL